MVLAEYIKSRGFKSLAQFLEITGVNKETLRLWHKNPDRQKVFECTIRGAQLKIFTREDWIVINHYFSNGLSVGQSIDQYIEYKNKH